MRTSLSKLAAIISNYLIKPFVTQYTPGSVGRILLAVTYFSALTRFWLFAEDPPATMIEVLMWLLAYVLASKVLDWRKSVSSATSTSDAAPQVDTTVTVTTGTSDAQSSDATGAP